MIGSVYVLLLDMKWKIGACRKLARYGLLHKEQGHVSVHKQIRPFRFQIAPYTTGLVEI